MEFDHDLWPQIVAHPWKFRLRDPQTINLIQLHATRSGRTWLGGNPWTMSDELQSARSWFASATNRVPGAPHEAAMCNVLVGDGTLTRVLPGDMAPHHSIGHADATGLSIEICQPLDSVPFLAVDLELAAAVCAEWSEKYGIPIKVLPFLNGDNREAPGYVRHDRSAQGRRVGKTDPGSQFPTDSEWEAMGRGEDDMALAEENRKRMNHAAVLQMLAAKALAGATASAGEQALGHGVINAMKTK